MVGVMSIFKAQVLMRGDHLQLDSAGRLQHSLELAGLVSRLGLVAATYELAADEDAGHRAASSQLAHVVLDLVAVLVILYLLDLNVVRRDVVFLQNLLGLDTKGAVALGDDENLLVGNLLIHKLLDTHDFYDYFCNKKIK